jgi:hypothetical protein
MKTKRAELRDNLSQSGAVANVTVLPHRLKRFKTMGAHMLSICEWYREKGVAHITPRWFGIARRYMAVDIPGMYFPLQGGFKFQR